MKEGMEYNQPARASVHLRVGVADPQGALVQTGPPATPGQRLHRSRFPGEPVGGLPELWQRHLSLVDYGRHDGRAT
jgi:hypothetical protein